MRRGVAGASGDARAEAGFVLFNPNPATTDASGTVAVGVTIQAAEIGTFDVFDLALQSRHPALRLVDFRPSQEWLDLVWGATPFPIMPVPVGVVGGVLLTDVASLYLGDLVIDATGALVEEYFVDVLNGSYLAHGFFFGDMMGELLFGSPLVVNVPEPSPAFLMLVCLLWALPTKRPPLSDGRGSDKSADGSLRRDADQAVGREQELRVRIAIEEERFGPAIDAAKNLKRIRPENDEVHASGVVEQFGFLRRSSIGQ